MDFTFTPEQQELRNGLARYLDKVYDFEQRQELVRSDAPYSADVWAALAEMGVLALPFSEAAGGVGGTIVDVVAVCEVLGEHLSIEPYVGTVLLSGGALAASDSAVAARLLERIIAGDAQVAFAHEDPRTLGEPGTLPGASVTEDGDGFRLTGQKRVVLGGAEAEAFVVTAYHRRGDGDVLRVLLLVPADSAGVEKVAFQTMDGRSAANLTFTDVAVPADHVLDRDARERIDALVADAIVALGAEAVGAMGELLRQTSVYTATRKQFGVPILSFQALAHRIADMKIAYTKARASLLYTTARAEAGRAGERDIAVLKAQVGRLGRQIGESAVQAHGGIGMTDELAIGHYLKRILAIDALFGSSTQHLRTVSRHAVLQTLG